MKKSRFTDSQIIAVLKQAEAGTPVPNLCRQHGISSATFYKWRRGSPPFSRTLTRRPIQAMRSVHVEAKEVQRRVQAWCG
ncbi:Transposase [compost metagenome]